MGWLITGGILFLLAALPLGVYASYDAGGAVAKVLIGPIKLTLYPLKKREKKEKAEKNKETPKKENLPKPPQAPKPETPAQPQRKKGGSLTDFLPLVRTGLDFLGDFRRKLRVKDLYLRLILAGEDPCDLAVNYGRVWAALGNLMPRLERYFVIKKRDVEVECDFAAVQTLVIVRLELTITLGRLLALAAVYGFRVLKQFLKIKKGGAET